jgi:hypothetical protein
MTKEQIKAEVERRFDADLARYGKAMGSWRKAKRNIREQVEREAASAALASRYEKLCNSKTSI